MKRTLAAILAALTLATAGVVLTAAPANAAAAHPDALGACDMDGTNEDDRGGWDLRNFVSRETDNNDYDEPVRPRTIRLQEPCVSDGKWAIPVELTEVINTAYDPEDPDSQPGEGSDGPCDVVLYERHTLYPSAAEMLGAVHAANTLVNCDEPVMGQETTVPRGVVDLDNDLSFGVPAITNANRTFTMTLGGTWPPAAPSGKFNQLFLYLICVNTTTGEYVGAVTMFSTYTTTIPGMNISGTCPVGSRAWGATNSRFVEGSSYDGTRYEYAKVGVFWRSDGGTAEGAPGLMLGWQSSVATFGNNESLGASPAYFVCSATRQGATFQIPVDSRYTFGDPWDEDAYSWGVPTTTTPPEFSRVDVTFPASGGTLEACAYLHEIAMTMCTYQTRALPSCTMFSWRADKYQRQAPYDDQTPDYWNCRTWDNPICDAVNWPEFKDFTTYANACPNPPDPTGILDFGWVPATIAYHAECLFVPKGGFDPDGRLESAWEGSAVGQLGNVLGELGTGYSFGEGCGVLLESPLPQLPITLDTCAWSWAEPVKVALGVAITVGFALWAISFLVGLFTGLFKLPAPPLVEQESYTTWSLSGSKADTWGR